MATFVLVHGAMHGGWCWRDVRSQLVQQGHDVFTPTLTGQGDRAHLLTRDTGVETHVEDIAALLDFEDLRQVHLVFHSYSGILAGPIAQVCGERLASVIYLGAFLGDDGESILDVEPSPIAQRYLEMASELGDGWRVPASPAFLAQWGLTDPKLVEWVAVRLTDFPLRCVTDPVPFDPQHLAALPQSYIRHVRPQMESLNQSFERAESRGFDLYDIESCHEVMVEAPGNLALLLQQISSAFTELPDIHSRN